MQILNDLITAALQLAGQEDQVSHNSRLWQSVGGRTCPIGWWRCSQSVFVDVATGEYDYGEPGGPGHAECLRSCPNRMQPAPPVEEYVPL